MKLFGDSVMCGLMLSVTCCAVCVDGWWCFWAVELGRTVHHAALVGAVLVDHTAL